MVYTTEQEKKLDAILKAFENYIDCQNITAILEQIESGADEYLERYNADEK